jgi:hypothetical protein
LSGLLREAIALNHRAIQLGVRIAYLALADEELKALSHSRSRSVALGEGRHHLRVVQYESRVHAILLEEVPDELVNQTSNRARRRAFDVVLLAESLEESGHLGGLHGRELLASSLLESLNHTDTAPWRREVDHYWLSALFGGIRDNVTASDFLHHAGDHLLC